MRGYRGALGAMIGVVLAAATCSLQNQEGPSVTCADLLCGKINACHDSIIAQCVDGKTMKYHVCTSDNGDICEASWQVQGQFKCDQYTTECEGCRPERAGCEADAGGD